MKKLRGAIFLTVLAIFLSTLGCLFLYLVGIDALEGRNDFQFFADSATYHEAARGDLAKVANWQDSIGVAGNFLGPLLLLRLVGDSYYLIVWLNVLLFILSITSIARTMRLDALKLALLLLLNPLTISSLLSVNKEIISLVFIALLLHAYTARSSLLFLAAAVMAMLVRWQLAVFMVVLLTCTSRWNPLRGRRLATVFALLIGLSLVYAQLSPILEPVLLTFAFGAEEYEGSGFYEWLVQVQNGGAYWLIFPLKAAHLLFGLGLRMDRLFDPTNIYNDVWQLLSSTALLVMFLTLWRRGRISLHNDLAFAAIVYIAVFALSPIYAPRYFFPVYVLWTVALATHASRPTILVRALRQDQIKLTPRPTRRVLSDGSGLAPIAVND